MEIRKFFQPLREPVEKSWQTIPMLLVVMVSSWIARYFTNNYLIWLITILIATTVGAIIYCAIVNKLNKKE